jgi:hypothetical protein
MMNCEERKGREWEEKEGMAELDIALRCEVGRIIGGESREWQK